MRMVLQNEDPTKPITANVKTAALISFLIVLPFALLEFTFNTVSKHNAAGLTVLFGLLWLLTLAWIIILMPIAQNLRAGNSVAARSGNLFLSVTFSALIFVTWAAIIIDQLPCFLGLPNCD